MAYFTQDYLEFFSELEVNNNKDWFHAQKKRYEKTVKNPFKGFVEKLALELQSVFPGIDLSDKYSVMRINRDIRFSKDKTPYKNHMACMIMPYGRKAYAYPGLYFEANHRHVRVYSGSHDIDKDKLHQIRSFIGENLNEFSKLVHDPQFIKTFGEVRGEKHKRLPPEFREAAEKEPLIANKQFYWFHEQDPKVLMNDSLVDEIMKNFGVAVPLIRFLENALGLPK